MKRKILNYIVAITSIIANIVFIGIHINSFVQSKQNEIKNEIKVAQTQEVQINQNADSLSELFLLLKQTDGWFIHSAMYPKDFPNLCYVQIKMGDNKFNLDISQKDVIKEVKKVITVLLDK